MPLAAARVTRPRGTRPTHIALTRQLCSYASSKTASPPTVGTPTLLPYCPIPATARRNDQSGAPKRRPSSSATGRAPIATMSRRIPPTPVAAPWNGSTADGWLCDSTLNATASPSPRSITPAFSPGPCNTRAPAEGRRRKRGAECLYPQCSDQSSEKTASSKWFGSRSSNSQIRACSKSVRPSARWSDCSATLVRDPSLAASQDRHDGRFHECDPAAEPGDATRPRRDLGRVVHVHQDRGPGAKPGDADRRAARARGPHPGAARSVRRRLARDVTATPRERGLADRGGAHQYGHTVLAALLGRDEDRLRARVDHPGLGPDLQRSHRVRRLPRGSRHRLPAPRRHGRVPRRRAARRRAA